jgi:hypothetical protein
VLARFGIAGIERGIAFGAFREHLVPLSVVMRCSSQPLSAKIAFSAFSEFEQGGDAPCKFPKSEEALIQSKTKSELP